MPPRIGDWPKIIKLTTAPGEIDPEDLNTLRDNPDRMMCALIYKDPYALAVSLRRFRPGMSAEENAKEASIYHEMMCGKAMECPSRWVVVKYEDLLLRTKKELSRIAGEDVEVSDPVIEELSNRGVRGEIFSRREFYSSRRYLDDLTETQKAIVDEHVNWDVMSQLDQYSLGGVLQS